MPPPGKPAAPPAYEMRQPRAADSSRFAVLQNEGFKIHTADGFKVHAPRRRCVLCARRTRFLPSEFRTNLITNHLKHDTTLSNSRFPSTFFDLTFLKSGGVNFSISSAKTPPRCKVSHKRTVYFCNSPGCESEKGAPAPCTKKNKLTSFLLSALCEIKQAFVSLHEIGGGAFPKCRPPICQKPLGASPPAARGAPLRPASAEVRRSTHFIIQ